MIRFTDDEITYGSMPEVDEPRDRRGRVVRVQRRQDEVARLRGLERDARRLVVADLADEDHVGVLAQHRAQHARERETLLLVDVDLVDALQLILDRVLDRDDVRRPGADRADERVERRRLAAARGPGHEDQPLRLAGRLTQALLVLRRQAEPLEADQRARRVEDAHRDLLAVLHRQGRHAEVDRAVLVAHLDAAVLRHAALGDVHPRHHLQARDQRLLQPLREVEAFFEDAVEAIPHDDAVHRRLDVHVARARLDALDEEQVRELHDRRQLGVAGERAEVAAVVL
jgi:hypothetical protein